MEDAVTLQVRHLSGALSTLRAPKAMALRARNIEASHESYHLYHLVSFSYILYILTYYMILIYVAIL